MFSMKEESILPVRIPKRIIISISLQIILLASAVILHISGSITQAYNWYVFRNFCIFLCTAVFCASDLRKRILLLVFSCASFVFLGCRTLIDFFRGEQWWMGFQSQDILFALHSVALSMLMLYSGAMLYVCTVKRKKTADKSPAALKTTDTQNASGNASLQIASLCLYIICMAFYLYCELNRLAFMRGRVYMDYFILYTPSYPALFGSISYCMPFALCAFLATLPKKKLAFATLTVYLLSAVPQLIIGIRNPFILNALFIFLYYFIRDYLGDKKHWLGRWELCSAAALLPFVCIGLSVLNYTREGISPESSNVFSMIIDLFYRQGASFWTLCIGHAVLPILPGVKRNFTFGSMIDYILYGRIGRMLFGTTALPSGNSAELATRSHSLSHAISYAGHTGYLEGHGLGSSYILEVFSDYGYAGIIIFNLLLGAFLLYCMDTVRKGWFTRTLILLFLGNLFFIPRAGATEWFSFLIHIHFWLVILTCQIGGRILSSIKIRLQNSGQRKNTS